MTMDREASSRALEHVRELLNELRSEYTRPSIVFRAKVFDRLGRFFAYVGDPPEGLNYPKGFWAVGKTPDEAMRNFDREWCTAQPRDVLS